VAAVLPGGEWRLPDATLPAALLTPEPATVNNASTGNRKTVEAEKRRWQKR